MATCVHCTEQFSFEGSEWQQNNVCETCGELIEEIQQTAKKIGLDDKLTISENRYSVGDTEFDNL